MMIILIVSLFFTNNINQKKDTISIIILPVQLPNTLKNSKIKITNTPSRMTTTLDEKYQQLLNVRAKLKMVVCNASHSLPLSEAVNESYICDDTASLKAQVGEMYECLKWHQERGTVSQIVLNGLLEE